jgi:cytochrome c5
MNTSKLSGWAVVAVVFVSMLSANASAQRRERSGMEVVDTVCISCHAKGEKGAPKIGDQQAWAARASQGLTALSEHALAGIRNMPAHGGNETLSDIEIERAITYLVNQSGGHWVEPLAGATPAVLRQSERIVQTQCAKCHQNGLDGAPKIGDRAAWVQRLKKGLDPLIKSAVHGRGPMPASGGLADLTDLEIQGAVMYMFNYGVVALPSEPSAATQTVNPYRKLVDGMEIYLGVARAEAMSAGQAPGKAPSGKGYYHLNISLFDAKTGLAITDAQVEAKVADPMGIESRNLEVIAAYNTIGYGNYFRMDGMFPYTITVQIQRLVNGRTTEAKFEYKTR